MILMLLAIAAVALVAASRSSMGLAVSAVQARRGLQQRWGSLSCRRTAMELAPLLLKDAEEASGKPVRSLRAQFDLGGQRFSLTISDEQAKANVNAMLRHRGREATRSFVRSRITGLSGAGEVHLPMGNPTQDRDTGSTAHALGSTHSIISLNHLLPRATPQDMIGTQDATESATVSDSLTCWGSGRINIRRAPDDVIEQVCRPLLGRIQISRLREALPEAGDQALPEAGTQALPEALVNIGVPREDVPAITERLTLESKCYSVWVVADNGKRNWYELGIAELTEGADQVAIVDEADVIEEEVESTAAPLIPPDDEPLSTDAPRPGANESLGAGGNEQSIAVENTTSSVQRRYYLYQW